MLFETNYTEVVAQGKGKPTEMTYYVRESWELERKREVLSPPPAQATALHCPRCGAALQKDTTGACAFCGSKIESGEFQWYVRSIASMRGGPEGRLLTRTCRRKELTSPIVCSEASRPSVPLRAARTRHLGGANS